MRRIGIVLANTPAYSETFFVSKIQGLAKAGFEIVLFARKTNRDFISGSINVETAEPYGVCGNKVWQFLKTGLVILRLLASNPQVASRFIKLERADGLGAMDIIRSLYVNAHILPYRLEWLYFGFATMGIGHENAAKAMRAKSAVSFRGYDISIYPLKHPRCYDRLFNKIDKVHSISDDLYEQALNMGLLPSIPYCKINPAINTGKFCHYKQQKINSTINIISIGRLTWKKGFEYSLQALSMLNVDYRYTIIGEGEDRERLMFAAYQWGIADKVVFAGKLHHDQIAASLQKCDIYLQPSVQEGFCNAVLEAQACGIICIVSDAEGLSENVETGKSGFVVPKRNPKALVDAIEYVIAMPLLEKQQISNYAVDRVRARFDIKDQIQRFISFYE